MTQFVLLDDRLEATSNVKTSKYSISLQMTCTGCATFDVSSPNVTTSLVSNFRPVFLGWFPPGLFWHFFERNEFSNVHAATFPIDLPEWAIQFTKEGNVILDQFLGTGTTMVASHQLKRKCYGMELDPKYCDVIVKRMLNLDDTLTVKRNGVDVTNEWK